MKKQIVIIAFLIIIIVTGIMYSVYRFRSTYLFEEDGSIYTEEESRQETINHIKNQEDEKIKKELIDFALENEKITQEDAKELLNE